ncbi:hypothetical protein ASF47_11735 [Nocardioides sp. Leaf285]|nr:hypothetical protein ASF47_11735 [Nocardioides sp. Leaf285]
MVGGGGEVPGVGRGLHGRGLGGRRGFLFVMGGFEGGEGLGACEVLGAQVEVDHPFLSGGGFDGVEGGEALGAVGDDADGAGLADLEGLDHCSGRGLVAAELGGGGADEVVEAGEVLGVAGRLEPGGAGGGAAVDVVGHPHVPPTACSFFEGGLGVGVVPGGRLGDEQLDPSCPQALRAGAEGGDLAVDVRGTGVVQHLGLGGDPPRAPAGEGEVLDHRPDAGQAVDQLHDFREVAAGVDRRHLQRQREGFGGELVEAVADHPRHRPGVGPVGVQGSPAGHDPQGATLGGAYGSGGVGGVLQDVVGLEGVDVDHGAGGVEVEEHALSLFEQAFDG